MVVLDGYGNKSVAGLPQIALLEKPSRDFLIWFTGFLEADGHVRHETNHMLKVTQAGKKGKQQCMMIRDMFNEVGSVHVRDYNEREGRETNNWDKCYEWVVTDPEVIAEILEWVEPFADPHTKVKDEFEHYL
jgi:hypothetical protein